MVSRLFRELISVFRLQGDNFVRELLSKELHGYAQRFPGGVNLPLIIQSTVEYLHSSSQISYT